MRWQNYFSTQRKKELISANIFKNKVTVNSKEIPMLRIALRVRLRFRSAQDDTEGEGGGRF